MKVRRGDVVLLAIPFSQGTGSKIRQALVVQNNRNNSRLTNTIVAAITRNVSRVHVATQLFLDPATPAAKQSGLLDQSALTCENLFTVGQVLVNRQIGRLPKNVMHQVDDCLKATLGLN